MILQGLASYYQRLVEEPDSGISPEGFAPQRISFALDLSLEGELLGVTDLREAGEKKNTLVPRIMLVPSLGKSRTVGIEPNFLWDGAGYVLGMDEKGKPDRTAQCHTAFKDLHTKLLRNCRSPELKSLTTFLSGWEPRKAEALPNWPEIVTANLAFRVGHVFLHALDEVKHIWGEHLQAAEEVPGVCLITGEQTTIATLHPAIKGVCGAQTMGAALSSYNLPSFESYSKKQNRNAPVGRAAAFAYTTALNHLIRTKPQSLRYGESTVVCWAERPSDLENVLFAFVAEPIPSAEREADRSSAEKRAAILRGLGKGKPVSEVWPELDPDVAMHVLALAPNVSRLSVGFYLQGSAEDFLRRVSKYFDELSVDRRFDTEPEFPSTWQIGRALLGPHKKMEDIKRLSEDILRAIFSNGRYPEYMLPMCLQRLRAGDDVNSVRAGIIKAMLIRNHNQEVDMSLNPDHPSPAYHLGRLFALLLGVQRKAIGPNINADIRDKFYGSASSTPAVVFPILLRNAQNHISKANAFGYDKLIKDVLDHIGDAFPSHLSLVQQGEFALGYYHQRATKAVAQDIEADTPATEQ